MGRQSTAHQLGQQELRLRCTLLGSQQARERDPGSPREYMHRVISCQVRVTSAQAWLTKLHLKCKADDTETPRFSSEDLQKQFSLSLCPRSISRKLWRDNASACAMKFQVNSYLRRTLIQNPRCVLSNPVRQEASPHTLLKQWECSASHMDRAPTCPALHPSPAGAKPGDHEGWQQRQDKLHQGPPSFPPVQLNHQPWQQRNGCTSLSQFATLYSEATAVNEKGKYTKLRDQMSFPRRLNKAV